MGLTNLSAIERCPLLGVNLKKIVTLFMKCRICRMSAIERFHCFMNILGLCICFVIRICKGSEYVSDTQGSENA